MQLWNWDHNKLNSFLDEWFFLILWKVPIFEVIKKNFFVRKILPPRYFPLFFCHINWRNFALLKTQTVLAVTLWNIKLFYVYVLRFQSQIVIAQRNLGQCTHLGLGWRRVYHFPGSTKKWRHYLFVNQTPVAGMKSCGWHSQWPFLRLLAKFNTKSVSKRPVWGNLYFLCVNSFF